MTKNILLVGLDYTGTEIPDVNIETLGLCQPSVSREKAAFALYEYDAIVINPASYTHFIFGKAGEFSNSPNELWDLKGQNNSYDLDSAFDAHDRGKELAAAIRQGTRVIWLLAEPKSTKFFGKRSVYIGYAHGVARRLVESGELYVKKTRRLEVDEEADGFGPYFDLLRREGWDLCLDLNDDGLQTFARSLEGLLHRRSCRDRRRDSVVANTASKPGCSEPARPVCLRIESGRRRAAGLPRNLSQPHKRGQTVRSPTEAAPA